MRTQELGASGPEISVVGFGAWEAGAGEEWGQAPPDDRVVDAIRSGLDAGITWIDTAEVYGGGHSEEIVGRAVAERRDEIIVASKVAPIPEGSGFRAEQVRAACEASLRRLGTDRIDLYQLHWPDDSGVPVEDTWGAMAALQDAGLVRWIGVSNFDQALIERCEAIRHVDSLQNEFSMLALGSRELIAWCGRQGVGTVSYAPLAYGLLTGAISAGTTFSATDFRADPKDETHKALFAPEKRERSLAVVEGLRPLAERMGAAPAQLALAWNVAQPGVTSAIAGSRNPEHARTNAEAGDLDLDPEILDQLSELLPLGPDFP